MEIFDREVGRFDSDGACTTWERASRDEIGYSYIGPPAEGVAEPAPPTTKPFGACVYMKGMSPLPESSIAAARPTVMSTGYIRRWR